MDATRSIGRGIGTALVVLGLLVPAAAGGATLRVPRADYRPGQVLLALRPGARPSDVTHRVPGALRRLSTVRRGLGATAAARIPAAYLLRLRGISVAGAIARLRSDPSVAYVEPDYLLHESAVPNDPFFALQWGSQNTGQAVNGVNGTPGADDSAYRAWDITTGDPSIVVAETDSGIEYTHPDLAANVWSNPGGIGGCPAGTHGYNELAESCDPMDDETVYDGHGTHVAGIIGASGNNGIGVAGMNWHTKILAVKWLNSNGWGDTSTLIEALNWIVQAKQAGVNIRVVNDSATFYGDTYSQALSDEIDVVGANGILFVTAAGNTGDDNDNLAVRRYPCGYDRPTEICVTASDQHDQLPSWANYGVQTVDLAAPGDEIYSTLRGGSYGYISGGSMAAAQVSGAAALILARENLSVTDLKADILDHVDVLPSLSGLVRTGGRLDVCKAMPGCAVARFGKQTIGATGAAFAADEKQVNRYLLPVAGSVQRLRVYLTPTSLAGRQQIQGVIYADSSTGPGALLGVTQPRYFASTDSAGWFGLPFKTPPVLAAGAYWIGVITGASGGVAGYRYDLNHRRDFNADPFSNGPSNPFGAFSSDQQQMSLYAVYAPS
jgi:subtilisin family serine protease